MIFFSFCWIHNLLTSAVSAATSLSSSVLESPTCCPLMSFFFFNRSGGGKQTEKLWLLRKAICHGLKKHAFVWETEKKGASFESKLKGFGFGWILLENVESYVLFIQCLIIHLKLMFCWKFLNAPVCHSYSSFAKCLQSRTATADPRFTWWELSYKMSRICNYNYFHIYFCVQSCLTYQQVFLSVTGC